MWGRVVWGTLLTRILRTLLFLLVFSRLRYTVPQKPMRRGKKLHSVPVGLYEKRTLAWNNFQNSALLFFTLSLFQHSPTNLWARVEKSSREEKINASFWKFRFGPRVFFRTSRRARNSYFMWRFFKFEFSVTQFNNNCQKRLGFNHFNWINSSPQWISYSSSNQNNLHRSISLNSLISTCPYVVNCILKWSCLS